MVWCGVVFVSRLVEEVKQKCASVKLQNEDVYMATTFQDFIQMFVRKLRGEGQEELVIDYVSLSTVQIHPGFSYTPLQVLVSSNRNILDFVEDI